MTAMAFFGASVSAPIAEAGEVNGEVGTAATCYGQKKKYNISIGVGVTGLMRTTSHCDDINIQSINRNALARGCFYRKADPQELLYCGSLKTVSRTSGRFSLPMSKTISLSGCNLNRLWVLMRDTSPPECSPVPLFRF